MEDEAPKPPVKGPEEMEKDTQSKNEAEKLSEDKLSDAKSANSCVGLAVFTILICYIGFEKCWTWVLRSFSCKAAACFFFFMVS